MVTDARTSPFVTAEELARVLRVSAWTIKSWARRVGPDALPSYKGGKRVLFYEVEALKWFTRTQRRNGGGVPEPRHRVVRRRPRRQRRDAGMVKAERSAAEARR